MTEIEFNNIVKELARESGQEAEVMYYYALESMGVYVEPDDGHTAFEFVKNNGMLDRLLLQLNRASGLRSN